MKTLLRWWDRLNERQRAICMWMGIEAALRNEDLNDPHLRINQL